MADDKTPIADNLHEQPHGELKNFLCHQPEKLNSPIRTKVAKHRYSTVVFDAHNNEKDSEIQRKLMIGKQYSSFVTFDGGAGA